MIPSVLDTIVTVEDRIIATIVLLLLLLFIGIIARYAKAHVVTDSRNLERVVNAVIVAGLLPLAAGVGWAILSLWEVSLLDLLGITEPVVVLTQAIVTIGLLLGVYVLTGVVHRFIAGVTDDHEAISQHQTELIFRVTQVSLYIFVLIVLLGIWRQDVGGLLVGAGFLGIVLGLAAQQTIGSLIAGFVLMFSRPFEIGDWVQIGDREGIVTEITIVTTRIETFDGEYVMIPNDVVSSNEVINRTRKGRLRIEVTVGVDYDTDLGRAVSTANAALKEVDEILTVPQPKVVIKAFGESSIDLGLRVWIDKPSARRRARAQTAVIAAVKGAFDQEGIKIPFPQRELMGRIEEGGVRIVNAGRSGLEVTPDGGDE